MGTGHTLDCRNFDYVFGFNLGCGEIQPDFHESVAKKRKSIRSKIAALSPQMVPGSFRNDLALYHCTKCNQFYNRALLQFDYFLNEGIASYHTTELCTMCKGMCTEVTFATEDDARDTMVEHLPCPSCKMQTLSVSMSCLWD